MVDPKNCNPHPSEIKELLPKKNREFVTHSDIILAVGGEVVGGVLCGRAFRVRCMIRVFNQEVRHRENSDPLFRTHPVISRILVPISIFRNRELLQNGQMRSHQNLKFC